MSLEDEIERTLRSFVVEGDEEEDCELCGGKGEVMAHTVRARGGTEDIVCPLCAQRDRSQQARAALARLEGMAAPPPHEIKPIARALFDDVRKHLVAVARMADKREPGGPALYSAMKKLENVTHCIAYPEHNDDWEISDVLEEGMAVLGDATEIAD